MHGANLVWGLSVAASATEELSITVMKGTAEKAGATRVRSGCKAPKAAVGAARPDAESEERGEREESAERQRHVCTRPPREAATKRFRPHRPAGPQAREYAS